MTETRPGLGGVILAAGASERMGRPKALLPLLAPPGRPLVLDQVDRLLRAGCARVAVVMGADAEAIAPVVAGGDTRVLACRNEEWRLGAFSSLRVGLAALGECAQGVLVLPLDVPGVAPSVMAALAPRGEGSADAIVPVHEGRGGHPVWLSPACAARVRGEPATSRLDRFLAACDVRRVEVSDPHVRGNVNTPEDWARFLSEPEA